MSRVGRVRIPVLLILGAVWWQPSAHAQTACLPAETIQVCLLRLTNKSKTETVKADQVSVRKKTETGLESIAGLSSSVKDFLPLLQLSGVLGEMQKDDKSGAVSVALNLPGLRGDARKEFQLKAVIETSPKLFEGLRKQLPAKDADALEKSLLKGAEKKDNYAIHASYTYTSRRFGRDFTQYADLYAQLFAEVLRGVDPSDEAMAAAIMKLSNAAVGVTLAKTPWGTIAPALQAKLEPLITQTAEAELASDVALAAAVKRSGISYFGQLVNNQPQLIVTASRSERATLFGPKLTTGRISFEMGLGNNLNAALKSVDPRPCAGPPITCVYDAYRTFASALAKQDAIRNGGRLAFHVEAVHNDSYNHASADPALALSIQQGTSWSTGLDYGRLVGVDETGAAAGRVDVALQWERPAHKLADQRVVVSATITRKLGEASIPFGVIYASNPKFLTGFDHGLTANVGLKFNLFPALK